MSHTYFQVKLSLPVRTPGSLYDLVALHKGDQDPVAGDQEREPADQHPVSQAASLLHSSS